MEDQIQVDPHLQQAIVSNPFSASQTGNLSNNNETFFSKKKKKWILAWGILFIFIIFIAIRFLLNLSLSDFFSGLSTASSVPYFFASIIFGFLTFFMCEILLRIMIIKEKLRDKLNHVTRFEWLSFSIISFVIQSITPFSLGSEPYSIWWLNKKGVPLRDASASVAVTSFCWFIGQFIITWPSFIHITVKYWDKISSFSVGATYWAILAGLFVDISVALFIFAISYSRKVHFYISLVANNARKYFGLEYSTHDEISQKYLRDNIFQKMYMKELWKKSTVKVVMWYLFNNVWIYFLFVFMYRLFNNSSWSDDAAIKSYHMINVSTTANNFSPLPSSEGSLQVVIENLLSGFENSADSTNHSTNHSTKNAIFLWRFFGKYLGMIIGFVFLAVYGFSAENFFDRFKKFHRYPKIVHEVVF